MLACRRGIHVLSSMVLVGHKAVLALQIG